MTAAFPTLTVYQPWASLLAHEFKAIETRGWPAPKRYIGQLMMIHAGKTWGADEQAAFIALKRLFPEVAQMPVPLGCIVAACRLVEVVPSEQLIGSISARERAMGNYDTGRYGWRFEVVKLATPPIKASGKQGIWTWSREGEGQG